MPTHEEHCLYSLRKYGKRFDELHKWMDEPCVVLGKEHRMYRHDPYTTPQEAKRLFGEYADHACLDHIILDWRESPNRFKRYERRGMPAGICPRCGSTLVWRRARLSGELYKGCTNYEGGCRYHERSYKRTPRSLKGGRDTSYEEDAIGIWWYMYTEEVAKEEARMRKGRRATGKIEAEQRKRDEAWIKEVAKLIKEMPPDQVAGLMLKEIKETVKWKMAYENKGSKFWLGFFTGIFVMLILWLLL